MWSRERFKEKAKQILSHNYWLSFGACIVVGMIVGVASGFITGMVQAVSVGFGFGGFFLLAISQPADTVVLGFIGMIILVALVSVVIALVVDFFLNAPLYVGLSKFFLESRKGNCAFENTFAAFSKNGYISIVKAMAWRDLFLFLWSLLFVIPGIIMTFSYFLVPFIMADNPKMDYRRALNLSKQMTEGYKWDIFVLQLSFIGWYLLGALCCGIGGIFVAPYHYATNAEMYAHLRKIALAKGYCTPAELNLTQMDYNLDYCGQN